MGQGDSMKSSIIYKDIDCPLKKLEDSQKPNSTEVEYFVQHLFNRFFYYLPNHTSDSSGATIKSGDNFLYRNYNVAITGSWGSGKTSLLNMTLDELNSAKNNVIAKDEENNTSNVNNVINYSYDTSNPNKTNGNVIWLEPWYFGEKDSILKYFLESIKSKLIEDSLLKEDDTNIDDYINKLIPNKKIKSILYFHNLLKKEPFAEKLKVLLALFSIYSIFIKLNYINFINGEICPILILLSIFSIGLYSIYWLSNKFKSIINKDNELNPKDLESIKQRISKVLMQEAKSVSELKRYIVVIDDIDRLTDSQIVTVMTSVKQIIDFPNIMFILLYDEKHVNSALSSVYGYNDELKAYSYMDKIINLKKSLELSDVKQYLDATLDNLYYDRYNKTRSDSDKINAAKVLAMLCTEGHLNMRDAKLISLEFERLMQENNRHITYNPERLLASIILKIRFFSIFYGVQEILQTFDYNDGLIIDRLKKKISYHYIYTLPRSKSDMSSSNYLEVWENKDNTENKDYKGFIPTNNLMNFLFDFNYICGSFKQKAETQLNKTISEDEAIKLYCIKYLDYQDNLNIVS